MTWTQQPPSAADWTKAAAAAPLWGQLDPNAAFTLWDLGNTTWDDRGTIWDLVLVPPEIWTKQHE